MGDRPRLLVINPSSGETVALDDAEVRVLAVVLSRARDRVRASLRQWPATLAKVEFLSAGDSGRQQSTRSATPQRTSQADGMNDLLLAPLKLLDRGDVAETLRVSVRQVDRYMDAGELTYVELGRRRLVDPQDLERFINDHRRPAA